MSRQFDGHSPTRVGLSVDSVGQCDLIQQTWADGELRQVLELVPDAMIIINDHGQIALVNAQTEQLFGYNRHELLGQPVEILMPERFRGGHREHVVDYFANPCARAMGSVLELYGLSKEGSEFPVEISLRPIETAGGVIVSSAIRDITERKLMPAIDEARILAEAIVETVREPMLILNTELRVQAANRSFYQTFRITPQETENQLLYELGNRQWDIPPLRRLLEKVLPEHTQFNDFEVKHSFEHMGQRTMLLNARALDREGDRAGLILLAIEDVTERKRAEEQLQHHADELQRTNRELQDFAYVVSHDLRAPLVNIEGFSKELASSCERLRLVLSKRQGPKPRRGELTALLDEDIPEAVDFITTSTAKMDSLLSGVLKLSRVGGASLRISELDMNQICSKIVESMQFALRQAGELVQVDTLPPCQGDEIQITQVFSNLLDNALKYLDPDRRGAIQLSGKEGSGVVVYSVEDNGVGIAEQHQGTINKIFHRLDPQSQTGEGLGLTIVRRVLDRHGGKIWVESEPNKGSKFYVSLPSRRAKART